MSSEKYYLALRLEGPLQSWGFDSQYNRRNTGLMPTKSGIAGICSAALGLSRGSENEKKFLDRYNSLRMTAIAIPRHVNEHELPVGRLQDYHTVQKTRRASGSISNDCVLTHRQYLTDASFGVILEGKPDVLSEIASALADPKWGIWLGRKNCIPTTTILAGFKEDLDNIRFLLKEHRNDALRLLIGEKPLESFTRQEDVDSFVEGHDSLPDKPVSFATERRQFSPRRVRTEQASENP